MERLLRARTVYIIVGLIAFAAILLVAFHPWSRMALIPDTGIINEAYGGAYSSDLYKVSFKYPSDWQKDSGTEERYGGESGFFVVSAAPGDLSLGSIAADQSGGVANPYGTSPTTESFTVDGEAAGLILPSSDQNPIMGNQAALIVAYPKPIKIGGQEYAYFVLLADSYHIRSIAATLQFK